MRKIVIAHIHVDGVTAVVSKLKKVPNGIVGAAIQVTFGSDWTDLSKTAVFQGAATKDALVDKKTITIPAECVNESGYQLRVGFYGVSGDTLAIPTIWADLGRIQDATDPSGDTSTDPTLPVWAQMNAKVEENKEDIEKLNANKLDAEQLPEAIDTALAQAKESGEFDGVPGADGIPGKDGADGYTPQKGIDYFDGQDGQPGKDGSPGKDGVDGYTPVKGVDYWTEADKAEMVSSVIAQVQAMIDAALGGIENGTY